MSGLQSVAPHTVTLARAPESEAEYCIVERQFAAKKWLRNDWWQEQICDRQIEYQCSSIRFGRQVIHEVVQLITDSEKTGWSQLF